MKSRILENFGILGVWGQITLFPDVTCKNWIFCSLYLLFQFLWKIWYGGVFQLQEVKGINTKHICNKTKHIYFIFINLGTRNCKQVAFRTWRSGRDIELVNNQSLFFQWIWSSLIKYSEIRYQRAIMHLYWVFWSRVTMGYNWPKMCSGCDIVQQKIKPIFIAHAAKKLQL